MRLDLEATIVYFRFVNTGAVRPLSLDVPAPSETRAQGMRPASTRFASIAP